jgi:glycosyltransferase involved in cell wall biosynthesis
MRVLHVARGGLDDRCDRLLITLARERGLWPGMHSRFALCQPGRFGRELEAAGAVVHDLGAVRARDPLSLWRARSRLRSIVDENRIEAVVCHRIQAFEALSQTVKSIHRPLILWAHSPDDFAGWTRRPDEAAFADMVLCNSEFTASGLRMLSSYVAIETIYYPLSPPEHREGARTAIRRQYRVADDEVVVCCGLDSDRAEAMIRAGARMHELRGWTIWFIAPHGHTHDPASFKHHAREAGIADRVQFMAASDGAADLVAAADVYCEPDRKPQAFSPLMIEALYRGLPVLATALGATGEIVDESCAILVPPHDRESLAAALCELIVNHGLRSRLGAAGPPRARALCDPREQMRRLANCLARTTAFELGSFEARTR